MTGGIGETMRVGFGAPMAGVPDNPAAQFTPSFPE